MIVTGKYHNAQVYYIELVGGRDEAELVQSYTHAAGRAAMNSELEEVRGLSPTLLEMSQHCGDAIRRHQRQKPRTTQAKPSESKEARHGW